jgi:hypothetical protein
LAAAAAIPHPPTPPPTPQASRCALASQVVTRPRRGASAEPLPPIGILPANDVHAAARECHPPNPTRPPQASRYALARPDGEVTSRLVPERGALEAFHCRPYRSAPSPCCCVLSPSAARLRAHHRQSAAVDLVPHHGVVTLHLLEQLPTLLLNAGRETTRRLVPLRTACPLMCIPDRLSPVIWTISSIRSKGSSGKFQSWFWTSG